jgi:hypothetical protein
MWVVLRMQVLTCSQRAFFQMSACLAQHAWKDYLCSNLHTDKGQDHLQVLLNLIEATVYLSKDFHQNHLTFSSQTDEVAQHIYTT